MPETAQYILWTAFYILIFPGALFTSVVGLFLAGVDRKVIAHMQRRIGPPIRQPMYDFFKLLGKETIIPHAANKFVFLAAPVIGFVSLAIIMLFIPIFGFTAVSGSADLIVILYLITIGGVALIVGGSASGSPYAGIGVSREMVTMMSYELPFVLVLLAVARKVGGSTLVFSMEQISQWQVENGHMLFQWSMIPAAIAFLLIIPAEVGMQPFDVAEAETEICEGPLIEYSGAPLAVFKLNTAMKMIIMTGLFTSLFLGQFRTGYYWADALLFVAICTVLTILCMTTVHAVTARLKIEHLFKFYWTIVTGLALSSLILVWLGL
ncbi:MAG: NADH-quinone oxidoreductase subunit H [Lachnospiraceae bacterium]|nr:NADH-quinone oxidoreductase subunit H [Lachnospiraceae bacterium]